MNSSDDKSVFYTHLLSFKINDTDYYCSSETFVKDSLILNRNFSVFPFSNCLFTIESEEGANQNTNVIFGEEFSVKHIKTGKYLTVKVEESGQESETIMHLELRESPYKSIFFFEPCFQYQSKISSNVKYGEEVYMACKIHQSRIGYFSARTNTQPAQIMIGFNNRSMLNVCLYSNGKNIEDYYCFNDIVSIKHMVTNTKFQSQENDDNVHFLTSGPEGNINTGELWILEREDPTIGGIIKWGERICLKNAISNKYLSLPKKWQMSNNTKVFNIALQVQKGDNTYFVLKPIKNETGFIRKGSYFRLLNEFSNYYIGNRKQDIQQKDVFTAVTTPVFDPQDVMRFNEVQDVDRQSMLFSRAVKIELESLNYVVSPEFNMKQFQEKKEVIARVFEGIKIFLLKNDEDDSAQSVIVNVRRYAKPCMGVMCSMLRNISWKNPTPEVKKVQTDIYTILRVLCKNQSKNQKFLASKIRIFLGYLMQNVGAEQLLCEIYKNNGQLLYSISKPDQQLNGWTVVEHYCTKLDSQPNKRTVEYYKQGVMFVDFCQTLLFLNGLAVDINQKIVVETLFENGLFRQILVDFRIENERIKVKIDGWIELEALEKAQPTLFNFIQRIVSLFSNLCYNRNFISKKYISKLFTSGVLINYLQLPISNRLKNIFFNLISNTYVDSFPRIERPCPIRVIVFNSQPLLSKPVSLEESMDHKLNQVLLQKHKLQTNSLSRFYSRRGTVNNLISTDRFINQPTEPTLGSEQLELYILIINDRIEFNDFSVEMLKAIKTLIKLECYDTENMMILTRELAQRMKQNKLSEDLKQLTFEIFQTVKIKNQELSIKKFTLLIKKLYDSLPQKIASSGEVNEQYIKTVSKLIKDNYKTFLDSGSTLKIPKSKKKKQTHIYEGITTEFNDMAADINSYRRLKINELITDSIIQSSDAKIVISALPFLEKSFLHKYNFLRNIRKCVLLTQEDEIKLYEYLFEQYKKLKNIVFMSQAWAENDKTEFAREQQTTFKSIVSQLTSLLYDSADFDPQKKEKMKNLDAIRLQDSRTLKNPAISSQRQLIMKTIGYHEVVIQMLDNLRFLVTEPTSRVHLTIMFVCFEFLEGFVVGNVENKDIVYTHKTILEKYTELTQVGQSFLITELYKNNSKLIYNVKMQLIETFVNKIITSPGKSPKLHEGNFKPEFLNFLSCVIEIDGEYIPGNCQKILKAINKERVFLKLLFLQEKYIGKDKRQIVFYLNIDSIVDGQVPYIYQVQMLRLINKLVENFEPSKKLRNKVINALSFQYLLTLLIKPDIYQAIGLQPKLNFLLKKEIYLLVLIHLEKPETQAKLLNNKTLHDLLEFINKQLLAPDLVEDLMNCNPLTEDNYKFYLNNFKDQFLLSKADFSRQYIMPFITKVRTCVQKAKQSDIIDIVRNIESVFGSKYGHKAFSPISTFKSNISQQQMTLPPEAQIHSVIQFPLLTLFNSSQSQSPQKTFLKMIVLQLMQDQKIASDIETERKEMYEYYSGKGTGMIKCFASSIRQLCISSSQSHLANKALKTGDLCIRRLSEWFKYCKSPKALAETYFSNGILETLFQVLISPNFNLLSVNRRKIYYFAMNTINQIIKNIDKNVASAAVAKLFQSNLTGYRFLTLLRDSILNTSIELVKTPNFVKEINNALRALPLNCSSHRAHLQDSYKKSLEFISLMSIRNQSLNFTEFFRSQRIYSVNSDIMAGLINTLTYICIRSKNKVAFTAVCYEVVQEILNTLSMMLYGPNRANQLFFIQSKFSFIFSEVFKLYDAADLKPQEIIDPNPESLKRVNEELKRSGLLLQQYLDKSLKLRRLSHKYLLNRLKVMLLNSLMSAIEANDDCLRRIKNIVSVETLKVNLIWNYRDFVDQEKAKFTEELLELKNYSLSELLDPNVKIKNLILEISFSLYPLIRSYEENEQQQQQLEEIKDDKNLSLVKSFFFGLKKKTPEAHIGPYAENFRQQVNKYHKLYQDAVNFLEHNILTIELNFNQKLLKVFFPKTSICNYVKAEMKQAFRNGCDRVSHNSKIQSLLKFQREFYEILNAQYVFISQQNRFHRWAPYIINQNVLLLSILIISLFVNGAFVVESKTPEFIFQTGFQHQTKDDLIYFLIISETILLIFAIFLFLIMIRKVIPLRYRLTLADMKKQQWYNESSILKLPITRRFFFMINGIFNKELIYIIFIITVCAIGYANDAFYCLILIQVLNRIQLAKSVVKAVARCYRQILVITVLLFLLNYAQSFLLYVFERDKFMPTSSSLFGSLLFIMDMSLKNDAGFLGSVSFTAPVSLSLQFFIDLAYIIFIQKVIFEIFAGTIIDQYSQIRQEGQSIREDEQTKCYICGLDRFEIDFELQGFKRHTQQNHNPWNYIFYMFYLKKKNPLTYSIKDRYVMDLYVVDDDRWVPNMNCLAKVQKKEAEDAQKEVASDNKDKADKRRIRNETMGYVKNKIEEIIIGLKQ